MILLGRNLYKNLSFPAFHGLCQDSQRVVSGSASVCYSGVDADHLSVFDLEGYVCGCDSNSFNAFLRSDKADINQLSTIT